MTTKETWAEFRKTHKFDRWPKCRGQTFSRETRKVSFPYTTRGRMTPSARSLTPLQWLICAIAALGFAFDIYEILMAPLVVGPAIGELTGAKPGTPEFNYWVGMFFWVPALVGGAFGLVGGYLTDRFGRRRVLVWSILLYAFSAMAAGFSTNIYMLLVLRSTTYIGVFVEFVAAVAWIAEIFPDAKQREKALGYTQAFSSIGGLHGHRRVLHRRDLRPVVPRDRRQPRAVALHVDLRRHPRAAADPDPAVPAGVAGLAAEEGRRHAAASVDRRAVHAANCAGPPSSRR